MPTHHVGGSSAADDSSMAATLGDSADANTALTTSAVPHSTFQGAPASSSQVHAPRGRVCGGVDKVWEVWEVWTRGVEGSRPSPAPARMLPNCWRTSCDGTWGAEHLGSGAFRVESIWGWEYLRWGAYGVGRVWGREQNEADGRGKRGWHGREGDTG